MSGWDPDGLATSPAFREYVATLRETASIDANHGESAGNGYSHNDMAISSDSHDDPIEPYHNRPNYRLALARLTPAAFRWLDTGESDHGLDAVMARRTFMATAAASAVAATGVGTVAGQEDMALDFGSELTPDPRIRGSVEVAEVGPDMGMLEYIADDGDPADLADVGGMLAADDDEDVAYNPVQLSAGAIEADTFRAFPRGEQYDESGDGDAETDVSILDSTHWSTDESGTAGTITVADSENTDGVQDCLQVSTSSQTSGDTATASFDASYIDIQDNIDQRKIQLVVDVDTLESATVVEIVLEDGSSNTVTVKIDDGLTLDDSNVVADGTGKAYVYQEAIGTVSADTLNSIQKVRINVKEGNADLTFAGFDVERTEELELGVEEYQDSNDDWTTQTIYEPQGEYSIQSLGGLDAAFDGATIYNVSYDVQIRQSEAPADWLDYEFVEAGRYDHDLRFQAVMNLDLPTAFDLTWSLSDYVVDQSHPSGRYLTVETASPSDPVTLEDTDDDASTSWTGRTGRFDGKIDSTVTLSSAPSASGVEAVHYDVLVDSSERETMEAAAGTAAGGGAGPTGGDGGVLDWVFSVPGMIVSALGIGGLLRWAGVMGGS